MKLGYVDEGRERLAAVDVRFRRLALKHDPVAKVWLNILPNVETGCWLWTRSVRGGPRGDYGRVKVGKDRPGVHSVMYEACIAKIKQGHVIDHLCRIPRCCNPAHLQAVTPFENVMRGNAISAVHARQTHCLRGHPLSGDNLMLGSSKGRLRRSCRECHRIRRAKS